MSFKRLLFIASLLVTGNSIFAHHGVSAPLPAGTSGFYTGSAYGFFSTYRKAEPENRNTLALSGFVGISIFEDRLGFTLSAPYVYHVQKDREDAARYGRAGLGIRGTLWRSEVLSVDAHLRGLFPMGNDSDIYVRENWSELRPALTVSTRGKGLYGMIEIEGIFPASKLPDPEISPALYQAGLLPDLEKTTWNGYLCVQIPGCDSYVEMPTTASHELKKAGRGYLRLGWSMESTVFFASFLYRTPYEESLVLKETKNEVRSVFREAGVGLIHRYDRFTISLGWARPLYKPPTAGPLDQYYHVAVLKRLPPDSDRFLLYRESWDLAVAIAF